MSAQPNLIDTEKMVAHLRARAINVERREILVSKLSGSDQEGDLTLPPNCDGLGRVRHFKHKTAKGWPSNPLPIEPARQALGLPPEHSEMTAQVFQNAACPWRCWYCFVPYNLLSANPARSVWATAEHLVALYEKDEHRPMIIDLSGGSPDLIPEWTVWMMRALKEAELANATYLWSDDNLSTTFLFDKLSFGDIEDLQSYQNYGRVCCFKGFDEASFTFNTQADASGYLRQFEIMQRMLKLDIDLYGYITLTSPRTSDLSGQISAFFDQLQAIHPNLPLRIIPLRISAYGPVHARMNDERTLSLALQEEAIACWNNEITARFANDLRTMPIYNVPIKAFGAAG